MMLRLSVLALLAPLLLTACNETTAATVRPSSEQANPQLQLLGRVNSLESEVSRLQNTVDVQAEELNKLRERLSSIYDDLDRRLYVETNSPSGSLPITPSTGLIDKEVPSVPQQAGLSNAAVLPAEAANDGSS